MIYDESVQYQDWLTLVNLRTVKSLDSSKNESFTKILCNFGRKTQLMFC